MVVELLRIHLPDSLSDSDLCKDICAVVAINLRRISADTEKSALAWDKRAYHSKAEELRHEMAWATPAAQITEALAYSPRPINRADIERLQKLLPGTIETSSRPRFKDVEVLRGAALAARQTLLKSK